MGALMASGWWGLALPLALSQSLLGWLGHDSVSTLCSVYISGRCS
jgi:hypothetical protein